MKLKGYLLAALAAAAYGTNPAFALPLYADGMNAVSVLLFRYLLGLPLLALLCAARGRSLRLARGEAGPVVVLGILMALSSLALFESYNYMNSGVASTLLFVYPVMVALLMVFFFHERFRASTLLCLALMGCGLAMLMRGGDGGGVSGFGFLLVMVSSLTYAIYIVMVNVSAVVRRIPTVKLLFYVLASGSVLFLLAPLFGSAPLCLPRHAMSWFNLVALAVIPTVLSLICTTVAIQTIGSTPTAIFGALEPVTAVVLSVAVLGQQLTASDVYGGLLIVLATTLVVAADRTDAVILKVRRMFPSLRRRSRR